MKKALVIEGSTRVGAGLQRYIDVFVESNPQYSFQQISLNAQSLPPFSDHRVDAQWDWAAPSLPILELLLQADLIVIASPVYWYSVSNLMKNWLDYWTYYMHANRTPSRFFLEGKSLFVLLVASHEEGTSVVFESVNSSIVYLHGRVLGAFLGIADREGTPSLASMDALRNKRLSTEKNMIRSEALG